MLLDWLYWEIDCMCELRVGWWLCYMLNDIDVIIGEDWIGQVWGIIWCCNENCLRMLFCFCLGTIMGQDKGKSVASSSSNKGKGKEKEASQSRTPKSQALWANQEPKAFGVRLKSPEAKRRWSHFVNLKHKHCWFLHPQMIPKMGIVDQVIALMGNGGFNRVFQSNLLTHHGPMVEFLWTLVVHRNNMGTLQSLWFQLGNAQWDLDMDELYKLIGGDKEGSFDGDHSVNTNGLWKDL